MSNPPNICAFRGQDCENVHFSSVVVCSSTGNVVKMFPRSDKHPVFLRSAAKPFQAYPLYQNPQSKDITLQEWAIICASHAATQTQLNLAQQILEKADAHISDLQCGPHPPIDESMAKTLICQHEAPTALHNNCSGKHAGMLLACRYYGWPIESYLDSQHPLQKRIFETIQHYSQAQDIHVGIDGCGAPALHLPLEAMARLFSQLSTQPELATLRQAMVTYPEIIGDALRIDTHLMQMTKGNLVAKVGAEGVLGIGNLSTGEGLAMKVHDGANPIRDRLVVAILLDLGWISEHQATTLWEQPQFSKNITNTQNKTVGHYTFHLNWA